MFMPVLALQADHADNQKQFMFNRYNIAKGPAVSMAQSYTQSPSQPLQTLQNPLLTRVNQGIQKSATTTLTHPLGYPNLPPVTGASTRGFDAAADTTLAQGPLPGQSHSEQPDQRNRTEPEDPVEGRQGIHTDKPAQAAEPSHVGDAPFTTSSHPSSSSAKATWLGWLASKKRH